jgi:hypothetical protein
MTRWSRKGFVTSETHMSRWSQNERVKGCFCETSHQTITPYILKSNPHTFYTFRGLKNQMWITIACKSDSRTRAKFWKNAVAAVRAVRIQYNNMLFYLSLITIYYSSDSPSSLINESLFVLRRDCAPLLREPGFTVLVWASRYRYDSSAPGIASDFNASVTSDIIQSVALWTKGGWRKGAD